MYKRQAFDYIDYNQLDQTLIKLNDINIKLSAFNSAKKDVVETTFIKEKDLIETYRNIALISKGAHPFDRVYLRMTELKDILNNH